jgi:diguanylate cyclase (GGDEF)-like protein
MNELLVQVIVVAVAANVLLLIATLIASRWRGRRREASGSTADASRLLLASAGETGIGGLDRPPAVDEGMGAGTMDDRQIMSTSRGPGEDGSPTGSWPQGDVDTTELDEVASRIDGVRSDAVMMGGGEPTAIADVETTGEMPRSTGLVLDPETGLPTGVAWEEVLRQEDARLARYGRPATVLVVELDRLESLAARLGQENADRLIPPVARALRRQARAADQVMRTGHARFNVLLPETDEIQAINYAERVRDACDAWLDAAAVSVRLAMGWASASAGASLRDASAVAERRMHADRLRMPPRVVVPRRWPTTAPGAVRPETVPAPGSELA